LRKSILKLSVNTEERQTPKKQRIRDIIKQPKEKFLTKNQEEYWKTLTDNEITLCFGPAGVGKSYIAMKRAIDLLWDDKNKYEKIIIVRPAVEAEIRFITWWFRRKIRPIHLPILLLVK
jgi:phosphate starvation-inducible PhoH-like protein